MGPAAEGERLMDVLLRWLELVAYVSVALSMALVVMGLIGAAIWVYAAGWERRRDARRRNAPMARRVRS